MLYRRPEPVHQALGRFALAGGDVSHLILPALVDLLDITGNLPQGPSTGNVNQNVITAETVRYDEAWATPRVGGAGDGIRTHDVLLGKQALYH